MTSVPRPRTSTPTSKHAPPPTLKKLLGLANESPLTKRPRSKKMLLNISIGSDVPSPKAILKSFEHVKSPGRPAERNLIPISTKCTIDQTTMNSPHYHSKQTLRPPSLILKTSVVRGPSVRNQEAFIRARERKSPAEEMYNTLKEQKARYFSPEEERFNISELKETRKMSKVMVVDFLDAKAGDVSPKGSLSKSSNRGQLKAKSWSMFLKLQQQKQNKNEALKKALGEANTSTRRLSNMQVTGENPLSSSVKVIKLNRANSKNLIRYPSNMMSPKNLMKQKSKELIPNSDLSISERVYQNIRLKHIVEPDKEIELRSSLQINFRPFVCETLEDGTTRQSDSTTSVEPQIKPKVRPRIIRVEKSKLLNNDISEGPKSHSPSSKLSLAQNNLEKSTQRCIEKAQRLSDMVEGVKLTNNIMIRETIRLDGSRISPTPTNNSQVIKEIVGFCCDKQDS